MDIPLVSFNTPPLSSALGPEVTETVASSLLSALSDSAANPYQLTSGLEGLYFSIATLNEALNDLKNAGCGCQSSFCSSCLVESFKVEMSNLVVGFSGLVLTELEVLHKTDGCHGIILHQRTQICEFAETKKGFFPYPVQTIHAITRIL